MIKTLLIIAIVLAALFVLTFLVYWFNLDIKLVAKLLPGLSKHYDSLPRDKRL